MNESKHTPETALALAGVAIFNRGIGWQADATATLKTLAAEVERLRALQKATHEDFETCSALLAAERRKVEALQEALSELLTLAEIATPLVFNAVPPDTGRWGRALDAARAALAATEGGE